MISVQIRLRLRSPIFLYHFVVVFKAGSNTVSLSKFLDKECPLLRLALYPEVLKIRKECLCRAVQRVFLRGYENTVTEPLALIAQN